MAFKLETGSHGAEPDFFRKHSWLARNQVGIWRGVSLFLAVCLVISIMTAKTGIPLPPWAQTALSELAKRIFG